MGSVPPQVRRDTCATFEESSIKSFANCHALKNGTDSRCENLLPLATAILSAEVNRHRNNKHTCWYSLVCAACRELLPPPRLPETPWSFPSCQSQSFVHTLSPLWSLVLVQMWEKPNAQREHFNLKHLILLKKKQKNNATVITLLFKV